MLPPLDSDTGRTEELWSKQETIYIFFYFFLLFFGFVYPLVCNLFHCLSFKINKYWNIGLTSDIDFEFNIDIKMNPTFALKLTLKFYIVIDFDIGSGVEIGHEILT